MRTLNATLLAAQKKAHRLPYVEAKVYDYEAGIEGNSEGDTMKKEFGDIEREYDILKRMYEKRNEGILKWLLSL